MDSSGAVEEYTEEYGEQTEQLPVDESSDMDIMKYLKAYSPGGERTASLMGEVDTPSLSVQLDTKSQPSNLYYYYLRHKPKPKILHRQRPKPKPKPKVRIPTNLQKVFANRTVVKEHYFSSGSKVTKENERNLLTEQSPFKYPKDLEEFAYKIMAKAWRGKLIRKELKLKYNERNSYRSRQELDLLNRLFVEDPSIKKMKTIVDTDPEYFAMVCNRPIDKPFRVKKYIEDLRGVLRTKIVTGYRMDDIYMLDENFAVEQQIIDKTKKEFQVYVEKFEEFLENDYSSSMELLRQSDTESSKSHLMYYEYVELSKKLSAVTSIVFTLEEKWRMLKLYQKCLYLASPLSWRKKHDYHYNTESDERSSESLFDRYKLTSGEMASLHKLIEHFRDETERQSKPKLYFKEPSQLQRVFRFMEIQNLNSLLHSEELNVPLENARVLMETSKKQFQDELNELQDLVNNLTGGILWEEERAQYLEKLAKELLFGEFRELTINENVLDLQIFVEDAYEANVGVNTGDLSTIELMKVLEIKYRHHLLQLEQLPQNIVYKAESSCYFEEAKIMRIATEAAKRFTQIEQLIAKLTRLLEPIPVKVQKDLKWRSPPVDHIIPPTPPPEPLTEEDLERLMFFRDYCLDEGTLEENRQLAEEEIV